ncbi:Lon protease family protein [Vibrio tapetis subsp. quintayensis]|uniref:Lon protease family protein n=1 Tax=Vibrio tapetis TaxID=52443 RepID=UPI0025B41AD0|nr:Lon protease family protein [Vibrio tapetis]MDN3679190.1 Lon protease family protein [Vibrio tapetis subsp. quintayensis]
MLENWQSVTPQYDSFTQVISQYHELVPLTFLDVQPRLASAISRFDRLNSLTRVLLVNAPDNAIYRQIIVDGFKQLQEAGVISTGKPVVRIESLDSDALFGLYQAKDGEIVEHTKGYLEQADGGYLMVSANLILANPVMWTKLKSALLGDAISPINADSKNLAHTVPSSNFDIKLVVIGDRNQMGDLDFFDTDIQTGLCMFSEVELEIRLNEESLSLYLGYVKGLLNRFQLPGINSDSVTALLTAGARQCEDQDFAPLSPVWHNALLSEAALESKGDTVAFSDIKAAIEHKYYRESYLTLRAVDDILGGQVIIETEGDQVGQVNGLTVVEIPGHPISYGEPARISCVVHFGDGDINDVERKAELGGNLHAKGMMIMQAFVSSALNLDEPLPYSASVVFEQSYCEVDGDSASLAELCSLVSALSEQPINQQIAITGAVDQFGRVQAVGGLNEKIEGFFHICQHKGLTGGQGVILPKTNLKHLALHDDVIDAIKNEQFHIWSVESVDEAVPLLTGKALRGDDEDTILNKIAQRIDDFERHIPANGLITRLKQWFDHN